MIPHHVLIRKLLAYGLDGMTHLFKGLDFLCITVLGNNVWE